MASATVNGAAMAVSYVGNGGAGADSSPDGSRFSPYDEPPTAKRPASALASEYDAFTVPSATSRDTSSKKRRKQSNPVRLATSRMCSTEQETLDFEAPPSRGSGDDDDGGDASPRAGEDFNDGSVYRCPHCNVLFGQEEHLREHVEEEHVQKALERQLQQQNQKNQMGTSGSGHHASPFDLSASSVAFRASDSSSSEPSTHDDKHPQQATSGGVAVPCTSAAVALHSPKDMASLMALSAFGSAPFLIPVLPCGNATSASAAASSRIMTYTPAGPPGVGGVPTSGPPIRIFNPEAFCELCNKEFCNKYFLKTHKANKHGIYSVEALAGAVATTASTPTASQVASYTGSLIAAASMPIRPHLGGSPAASAHEGGSSNGGAPAATPQASSGASVALTSVLLGPSMAGKPMPVMNPEAFCDICQKEFCNKYFLKKHRQKIHGIQDYSASPAFGAMGPISALVDAMPITAAELSPSATTPSDLYYEYGARDLSAKILAVASQALMPKHSIQSLVTSGSKAITTTAHFGTGGEGYVTVAGYSFSPEHLREMGVINVDAFCELCCKEFCNKYFLRTHKQNKHGVGCEGAKGGHQQSVPLSLVMDKENHCEDGQKSDTPNSSNCGSTNGRRSTGSQEQTQEPPPAPSDLTCDVCSRPFSSAYLLKMHKFYFHNIDPTPHAAPDPGKLPHSPPETGEGRCGSNGSLKSAAEGGEAAPPLNEDLQKLQTMIHELNTSPKDGNVKCNICFHEMKNKYFLRAHMMNEHGELHNEDEISQGDDDHPLGATNGPAGEAPPQADSTSAVKAPSTDPESFCEICCKDMCSKYFLRTHMMTMHGVGASSEKGPEAGIMGVIPLPVPLDKIKVEYQGRTASPPHATNHIIHSAPSMHHHLQQQQQQQQHQQQQQQQLHHHQQHLGLSERPPMTAVTGRNFCEICNKELCNKYFMKTHMLKMHGINVDEKSSVNGATIGGVTCDICQKELCSKYFLKVHKQNTHGILEEPSMSKESYAAAAAAAAAAAVSAASMSTSMDKDAYHDGNGSDGGGGNRYFSHYTEVCPLCDRRFKSIKWLKTHVINDHADLAKENGLAELLGAEGYGEPPVHLLRMQHLSPRDYMLGADVGYGIKVEKPSSSSSSATTSPTTVASFHHPHHQAPPHRSEGDGGATTAHQHCAGELGSTGATAGTAGATTAGNASTTSSSPSSGSSACAAVATGGSSFATRKPLGPGSGTRIYHCSYCSYSTRWLSNLYAHEKRHTGLSSEGEKRFCCRICHRAYRYNHSLQRHLVSHKATGILVKHVVSTQVAAPPPPPFQAPSFCTEPQQSPKAQEQNGDDSNGGAARAPARIKKYRCSKCGAKYRSREQCLEHIHTHHNTRNRHHHGYHPRAPEGGAATVAVAHNCPVCPFSCSNKDALAAHLAKHQRPEDEDERLEEEESTEVLNNQHLQRLQNAMGKSQLPMTYAVPQAPPSAGSFIMQPFLISQTDAPKPLPPNTTFVPSLVYLPVSHKISETLTVAFTLSPA